MFLPKSSGALILCVGYGIRPELSIKESNRFTYSEIQLATNGFSKDNLIGEGEYGIVSEGTYVYSYGVTLLLCVLLLVCLSTIQQMGGIKKVIHVAFTHLALIVGDITRLEYLVSHTYLVTSFVFIGLDDGSCCTLPGKLRFTSGSERHSIDTVKLGAVIRSFDLNGAQEEGVLSCIAARECSHKNTVKLIWGPPGTGKTKTATSLLFALLKRRCRTLTYAPTNVAVLELTSWFIRLVMKSHDYLTYGLGDIVLFGNRNRMKIDNDNVFKNLCERNYYGQAMLASMLIPTPYSINHSFHEEDVNMSFGSILLHGLPLDKMMDLESIRHATTFLQWIQEGCSLLFIRGVNMHENSGVSRTRSQGVQIF